MGTNIFLEYSNFIRDLKEKIFFLQRKFNVCRDILNYDYSNCEIYEDEYQTLRKLKITEYRENIDKRYELSKEEVDFLKKNAQILDDGSIGDSLINDKFLKKSMLLESIFYSIKVHYFFIFFDDYTRKEKLEAFIVKHFDGILSSLENDLLIGDGKSNLDKKRKISMIKEKKMQYLERIYLGNEDDFISVIDEFFGTNVFYYNWYRKCEIDQEYENGFIYDEHFKASNDLHDNVLVYEGLIREHQNLSDEKDALINKIITFSSRIVDSDFSEFIKKTFVEKINIFFRKNNKKLLYNLFSELSMIEGVLGFYRYLAGSQTIIKIENCFKKYFESEYGSDETYVDVTEFIRNFVADVIDFYNDRIKQLDDEIVEKQREINIKSESIKQMTSFVKKGAKLQKDIFELNNDGKTYKIEGLTDEESLRVYLDMKEYLVTHANEILEKVENDFGYLLKR